MSILAVVVAYEPDLEALRRNLDTYAPWVDKVLLWRNSPLDFSYPGLELCGSGQNQGIAAALDYAWHYAQREGFGHLLTMDQDSAWEDFPAYLNLALQGPSALMGPHVNDDAPKANYEPSDLLITSGMLLPLPLLDRIGGWRMDFRVDALDVELVLHAKSLGIPAYKVGAGRLVQQFGRRHKTAAGFHVYEYAPERLYGIFRNHLLAFRAYPAVSAELRRMFRKRWICSRIPRILLGEKGRWSKLKAIVRGIRDGLCTPPRPVVGLVTWFGTPNYGTTLQAYATVQALRRLGREPYLLHRFDEPFTLKALKDNLNRRLGIRRFWKYAPEPWPKRRRLIRSFCRQELPSRWVWGPCSLKHLKKRTSLFLCGSDQLWNAHDHFRRFEFLAFAADCPRAAFATSIGTEDIPQAFQAPMRAFLAGFGPISLREQGGVTAVSQLTGRTDIRLAADPTFLLTAEEWKAVGETAYQLPPEPYLLCYLIRPGHQEALRQICAQSGLSRVVRLPAEGVGIRESLALIGGASLVVTDSFHGMALSANLSRNMLLLKRFQDNDSASQNPRLQELAARLGLEDRWYQGTLPPPVDWQAVQERIAGMRAQSWEVLQDTLAL